MTDFNRREVLQLAAGGLLPPWIFDTEGEAHAALYIYTRDAIRPRYRAVVQKAIQQRHRELTCGWRRRKNRPVLKLGPTRNAAHWKRDRMTKPIWAAWPFAAVLEFSKDNKPAAYIDWFRRKRGSKDGGAWFLDPAGIYVEHMNKGIVCSSDDRYGYAAVVDTPTGDVMGSNEFAVRGRVVREGGTTQQRGFWVRFQTPRNKSPQDWPEQLTPLVPWQLGRKDKTKGTRDSLLLASNELAVFGKRVVFRFPKVPSGLKACRG